MENRKIMEGYSFVPYFKLSEAVEMLKRSNAVCQKVARRHAVRNFSGTLKRRIIAAG